MDALIDRRVLFGNPTRARPRLSPDGRALAFLAPLDGVMNLWVAPLDDLDRARAVTCDTGRGIPDYCWAASGEALLFVQDTGGDENWHLLAVPPEGGEARDLTPLDGVQARLMGVSPRLPHTVAVGLNDRIAELHDVYRIDLRTGERELVFENEGWAGLELDDDLEVRVGVRMLPSGAVHFHLRTTEDGADTWTPWAEVPRDDALTTGLVGFDGSGRVLYMIDSRDRDTAALFRCDLDSGERTELVSDPRADVQGVQRHPTTGEVQAATCEHARSVIHIVAEDVRADLETLRGLQHGECDVVSQTLDDRQWLAAFATDDGAVQFWHFDRDTQRGRRLFSHQPELDELPLASMHASVIEARDGLELVVYHTVPRWLDTEGRPPEPLPTVLLVHGGPWARDSWGYHPVHQWLANRGYAVLSVNFRGSTGFGKGFVNAGDFEWAGAMHDDLLDTVEWAISQGIAQRDRVAIMGGSYGGYATLVGLTFTPEVFACGVDIVGPSSLVTLLETIPPYWVPLKAQFHHRVGNDETPEGRAELRNRSPLTYAHRIVRPLLIAQGANDPRVKQAESDQLVQVLREGGIPVQYALFGDEGHGFVRPDNRLAFYAVTEGFLAEHLGGRAAPLGDALAPSSIELS